MVTPGIKFINILHTRLRTKVLGAAFLQLRIGFGEMISAKKALWYE